MRIAVTYADGVIFQRFGHTGAFKIYEVEEGQVVNTRVLETLGSGHGALAGFLAAYGVDTLICGGIGGGARMALAQAGIRVLGGVSGDADDAVEALLSGELNFNPNACCSHHGEGHSCGGHDCASHGCGHNCGA